MGETQPIVAAILNIGAMTADALMILVLVREPLSYFRSYKNYFLAVYGFFFTFPISQLVLEFDPEDTLLRITTQAFAFSAVIIATLWGLLVTKLYYYPEKFTIRKAVTDPSKPLHLAFLLYLVPMVALLATVLADPNSIDTSPSRQAFYILDSTYYRIVGLSPSLLAIATVFIVEFAVYPQFILSRLRSELKDREVRNALRVIAVCFIVISDLLLIGYGLSSLGYSILGITNFAVVILLIVVALAFKKPTFLKAFLGVVPSLDSSLTELRGDQLILIYNNEDARIRPVSRFINESISKGNRVLYFHLGDDATLRDELSKAGVDVKHNLTKGNLRLSSIDSLYQGEDLLDEEAAINQCQEIAKENRALGKTGLRIVIDYGDLAKRPYQRFASHLTDPRWTTLDHYVQMLMTFTNRAFEDQGEALELLKNRVKVLNPSESTNVFSRTIGLSHDEIVGKKILLEYDPLSDYDKILTSLAAEAESNFERVVLFTRRESPVHSIMERDASLRVFVLTSRVSYPKPEGESRVLLPAFDSSLILDSLNKTVEAYSAIPFTVIFDNISHQIFTFGAERAQSFVRQALELLVSSTITAIFLFNFGAHDPKIVSMFESLFDMELIVKSGARVPEVRRAIGLVAQ